MATFVRLSSQDAPESVLVVNLETVAWIVTHQGGTRLTFTVAPEVEHPSGVLAFIDVRESPQEIMRRAHLRVDGLTPPGDGEAG